MVCIGRRIGDCDDGVKQAIATSCLVLIIEAGSRLSRLQLVQA